MTRMPRLQRDSGLSGEQRAALKRHGYPDLPARGVTGRPDEIIDGYWVDERNHTVHILPLRNRVCYLDGIEIDGHEHSDLDYADPTCIHCGQGKPDD